MPYTFSTSRFIPASAREIFAAFENADLLAQWWGPSDFRNTFEIFEFKQDGQWKFIMHGPDGTNYQNENVFQKIERYSCIVIEHVCEPIFTLTVKLNEQGSNCVLEWIQVFDSKEFAENVRHIIEPANEQNLDRLQAILIKKFSIPV